MVSTPLVFAATLLAAAAPPKDSPAEAKAVAVADWFPVKDGYRWEFAVTKVQRVALPGRPEHEQSITEKVVDKMVAGSPRIEVVSTREVAAAEKPRTATLRSRLSVDGDGIRVHAQTVDLGTGEPAVTSRQDAPMLLAPARVRPGDRWSVGTMHMGGLRIELAGEAVGFETVTTPAGTFERCLKIAYRGTSAGTMNVRGQSIEVEDGTLSETIWYAPGVGEVKQDALQTMKMKLPDGALLETRESKEKVLVTHGAAREPSATAAPKK